MLNYRQTEEGQSKAQYICFEEAITFPAVEMHVEVTHNQRLHINFKDMKSSGCIAVIISSMDELCALLLFIGSGMDLTKYNPTNTKLTLASNNAGELIPFSSNLFAERISESQNVALIHFRRYIREIPIRKILHTEGWLNFIM